MRISATLAATFLTAGAAFAAPINPNFYFTAYDSGNNGLTTNAVAPYPVAVPYDFTANYHAGAILLRGAQTAGTSDRKSFAFIDFHLSGVTSMSSAILNFSNQYEFYLNDGATLPPATPEILMKSVNRSNSNTLSNLDAAAYGTGSAVQVFDALAPITSTYSLDVTTLLNAALDDRSGGEIISLILSNNEDFSSLPNSYQGGYGNIAFTGFTLDFVEGPAPAATPAVPLPAGLPLLLAGLSAFFMINRRT